MKFVNIVTYKRGEPRKFVGKTLTELAEYQPLQKMLANLTIAGLNVSARQAMEFYDSNVPDKIDIPVLPRHISPDIVDVHQAALHFRAAKLEIEARVRAAHEKAEAEKLLAAQQQKLGTSRASGPEQGGGQSPPGGTPESKATQ